MSKVELFCVCRVFHRLYAQRPVYEEKQTAIFFFIRKFISVKQIHVPCLYRRLRSPFPKNKNVNGLYAVILFPG